LSERSKLWILAISCLVFAQACASILIPQGFALAVFSDVTQCILLLSGTAALIPNIMRNHGRTRLFWALMTFGIALWLAYQLLWSYFEVVLRRDVPDPFVGDIIIFLHIVPMMAALAMQPHARENDYTSRLGRLDFVLLFTWWIYLYLFAVIPWQYAQIDELAYGRSLNALYLTEKVVFLAGLGIVWFKSRGGWRVIYANLFGASLLYAASSYIANWAIQRNVYYTGSLYDLPLAASMAWISGIGAFGQDLHFERERGESTGRRGVWVARLGMTVIFSLPLFAAWSLLDTTTPARVRNLRLMVTLVTMLVMGGIVFFRQYLLDRELLRLLHASQESYDDLKRLQTQLIQSEKLASLGQLVGGAAHELNNPLTAMLGYSELLASSGLNDEQRGLAEKIAQQVRRTKVLIANLLNFARQMPGDKISVDVNTVARTAVQLSQPQFSTHQVSVQLELAAQVPKVQADPNQLLQVFLHIASNSVQTLDELGGGSLRVLTSATEGVRIEFISEAHDASGAAADPMGKTSSLALSACYGIVQDHDGRILLEHLAAGVTRVRIELPAMNASSTPLETPHTAPYAVTAPKSALS
jgi:signal transduction histidine kinase